MAQDQMQPTDPTMGAAAPEDEAAGAPEGAEDNDENEMEIAISVSKTDGTITVSLEPGDQEEQETQETPAKNIDDACRIVKQIYKQIMGAAPTAQDQQTEDQAYQQEMSK